MRPEQATRLPEEPREDVPSRGARHRRCADAAHAAGARMPRAAEPPAGGILDDGAGREAQTKGGGAGSALRAAHACALVRLPALPGWVGRCAPTARPPARRRLPGAWGRERPMRARGDGGRRGAGCAVRKRSAADADRAPPSPALGYGFPAGPRRGERGMGGVSEANGGGRGSGPPLAARE